MIGQCRFRSTNQIKAFRSKETWRNWVKKTIYVSFSLILKQNSSNFPNIYSENAGDNARYMRHRDSGPFRPSIATKDAETRSKMNTASISLTVRDRAISAKFSTHRVSKECTLCNFQKIFPSPKIACEIERFRQNFRPTGYLRSVLFAIFKKFSPPQKLRPF